MATTTLAGNHPQGSGQGSAQEHEPELLHVLPRWMQVVQDHVFLTFIVVAEMGVNGYMMASGTVGNPNDPFAGGRADWLHEAMWVTLFLAGAVMAGAILRMSGAAFYWFGRNWILGAVNVGGAFVVAVMEVWGSIMLRSYAPFISPADRAVLSQFGIAHPAVSVTDVVVAVALPTISLLWGFSTTKSAVKSAQEIAAEGEAKIAKAQIAAKVWEAKLGGVGGALRAGAVSALARKAYPADAADGASFAGKDGGFDPTNPGGDGATSGAGLHGQTGAEEGGVTTGKDGRSGRMLRAVSQVGGVPTGWLDARELTSWLRTTLEVETTAAEALVFIRAQTGARRCLPAEHVQGSPWIAPKAATLAAAKRKWGARPTTEASGA